MRYPVLIVFFIVLSLSGYSQGIDIELLKEINLERNNSLDQLFRIITYSAAIIGFGAPLILLGWSYLKNTYMRRRAFFILLSVTTSALIASAIKYAINKPRPFETYAFIQNVAEGGSPSFPSGHTADAFAFATAISIAFQKRSVIIPAFIWACAVGYSRMVLGVHYPSDVLGGMIIGSLSAFAWHKLTPKLTAIKE